MKMAHALHKVLYEHNLLEPACDEWIRPVLALLTAQQQIKLMPHVESRDILIAKQTVVPTDSNSKICLDAQSALKMQALSGILKMEPPQLIEYALTLVEREKEKEKETSTQ
jgi:hypothetical protein